MIAKLVHTPIGELVTKVSTWDPTRAPTNDVFRYIDISSVDQEIKAVRDVQQIRTHEAPSRARQLVRQNDVLASTVRPNLNAVAIVPNELDGATASTGFCILRARPDLLFPPYLFYWVRSPAFIRDMSSRATGGYPAVTDGIIRDSRIPSRLCRSRSGSRGFWTRRTPCGGNASKPSNSPNNSSAPPSSTCSAIR